MRRVVTRKNIYLLGVLVICLLAFSMTPSLAKFASNFSTEEDVVALTLSFELGISNIEEYEEVVVDANSYEVINVNVSNASSDIIYYGIWYKMVNPNKITDDITIARLEGTEIETSGSLESSENKTITIIIKNVSSDAVKLNIGVNSSTTSVNDIEYLGGKYLITGTSLEADYYYDNDNSNYVSTSDSSVTFTTSTTEFDYTGDVQTFTASVDGAYKMEAWGAHGGAAYYNSDLTGDLVLGGTGAYTSGIISLASQEQLYVYVGGSGVDGVSNVTSIGGYNGGGNGGAGYQGAGSGGGATDIRLVNGDWNDITALTSRIMVAGAGSGASNYSGSVSGGSAGSLIGFSGQLNVNSTSHTLATGGTQTVGGTGGGSSGVGEDGSFGQGGAAGGGHGSGGGSGYYGGGGAGYIGAGVSSGAGGSSYVSGYKGAVSAGNPQKFKFTYGEENGTNYLKAYDQFGTLIGSKETITSLIQNVERTINYIGRDTYDQSYYLGAQIFNLKITLSDGTVVLYYDFTKNTVNDLSGNDYHGTLMNGASLVYDGKRYSLVLDGVDDYMQVPTLPSTIDFAGGFTIEVEIIFNQCGDYFRIIDFENGKAVDNIIAYTYSTDNALGFHLVQGSGDSVVATDMQTSSVIQLNGTNYGQDKEVCETGDSDISCSYHYSGKVFKNAKMIARNASMPTHDGSSTMTGNSGNGYAKISLVVPTIEEDSFSILLGGTLSISDITCVDNGSGCKVVRINPGDTSTLSVGTHSINIMVIDDYGIVYQYTKPIVVNPDASSYIMSLYNDGTTLTTVNIGGSTDNPSVTLNETQGIMLDNNGEYRYYGASPNNYITFNGELWRIISVSNVKSGTDDTTGSMRMKIIRDDSIGNYSYDSSESTVNSGYGFNNWNTADINTLLNDLYYNQSSETCYNGQSNASTSCDFSSTGLSDDAKNYIEDALWNMGGFSSNANMYASDIYTFERGTAVYSCSEDGCGGTRTATWTGKVGLMHVSDYMYATDLSVCIKFNYYYDDSSLDYRSSECYENDWLYNGSYQWSISPYLGDSHRMFIVYSSGNALTTITYYALGVRPVVYLRSDVTITGGTGTSSNPYTLSY